MKKYLLLLALACTAFSSEPTAVQPSVARANARWEYGTLRVYVSGENLWQQSDLEIRFLEPKQFRTAMEQEKVIGPRLSTTDSTAEVMDALGERGWDLVSVFTFATQKGVITSYVFKRPKV